MQFTDYFKWQIFLGAGDSVAFIAVEKKLSTQDEVGPV